MYFRVYWFYRKIRTSNMQANQIELFIFSLKFQCIRKIIFKIIILNCLAVSKQRDKVPNDFTCSHYCLPLTCHESVLLSAFRMSSIIPTFYTTESKRGWDGGEWKLRVPKARETSRGIRGNLWNMEPMKCHFLHFGEGF